MCDWAKEESGRWRQDGGVSVSILGSISAISRVSIWEIRKALRSRLERIWPLLEDTEHVDSNSIASKCPSCQHHVMLRWISIGGSGRKPPIFIMKRHFFGNRVGDRVILSMVSGELASYNSRYWTTLDAKYEYHKLCKIGTHKSCKNASKNPFKK